MTYPEGTRLVVWNQCGNWWGQTSSYPDSDAILTKEAYSIVRESAAKCSERMLKMLKRIESGASIDDIDSELKSLIAEAEGASK